MSDRKADNTALKIGRRSLNANCFILQLHIRITHTYGGHTYIYTYTSHTPDNAHRLDWPPVGHRSNLQSVNYKDLYAGIWFFAAVKVGQLATSPDPLSAHLRHHSLSSSCQELFLFLYIFLIKMRVRGKCHSRELLVAQDYFPTQEKKN